MDRAINLALNGHNFVVLGQSGTGKTFLAKEIFKVLKNNRVYREQREG